MKVADRRRSVSADAFEERYRTALREHLESPCEATLGRAYELGRQAIASGKSLVETVSVHHRVFHELSAAHVHNGWFSASGDFLMEALSPFEMTHRGFQDAIKALRHMNETLEEQIKRMAYSVHDEAGQLLTAVHLALAEMAAAIPEQQRQHLDQVKGMLAQVEEQLRRFSHELRPPVLRDLGWLPALRSLADRVSRRAGFAIEIRAAVKKRLPESQEIVLYRVVQEALTNAAKYSKAKRVSIFVRRFSGMVCCCVQDDGIGFDVHALQSGIPHAGLGLTAMRERMHAIGGTLSIDSIPGRGTKILMQFPREAPYARPDSSRG